MKRILSVLCIVILCLGSSAMIMDADALTETKSQNASSRANTVISTNTTWALANSPYAFSSGDVLVEQGATLTIQPGVVVKFGSGNYLQVEGKLIAQGTQSKMITFTSNQLSPAVGDWDSIILVDNPGNPSIIKYCNIEYADCAIRGHTPDFDFTPRSYPVITENLINSSGQGIYFYTKADLDYMDIGADLRNQSYMISNNTITNCDGPAITVYLRLPHPGKERYTFSIQNNVLSNNDAGLFLAFIGVNVTVLENTIINCNGTGIWAQPENNFDIENNVLAFNDVGMVLTHPQDDTDAVLRNNTIAYNDIGLQVPDGGTWAENWTYIIRDNNIYNNSFFNINTTGSRPNGDWNFRNNWWGSTNTTQMDALIYDFNDDFNLAKILYKPYSGSPSTSAPVVGGGNQAPNADVGPDRNAQVNQTVYFDSFDSFDPDGDALTYKWDFGDGTQTGWQKEHNTSHNYSLVGDYIVILTVSDGSLIDMDSCVVHVFLEELLNSRPVAVVGPDRNVTINQTVYFDGSKSYDPDGDALSYLWIFGDGFMTDWLSTEDKKEPWKANYKYSIAGNYTVALKVTDGDLIHTDRCEVLVLDIEKNETDSDDVDDTVTDIDNETGDDVIDPVHGIDNTTGDDILTEPNNGAEYNPDGRYFNSEAIDGAVTHGLIGAEMSIDSEGKAHVQSYIEGMDMVLDELDKAHVKVTISGEAEEGKIFVLNIHSGSDFAIEGITQIRVYYDGNEIYQSPVAIILSAQSEEARFSMSFGVEEGSQILLYIPQFSEHTLTVEKDKGTDVSPDQSKEYVLSIFWPLALVMIIFIIILIPIFVFKKRRNGVEEENSTSNTSKMTDEIPIGKAITSNRALIDTDVKHMDSGPSLESVPMAIPIGRALSIEEDKETQILHEPIAVDANPTREKETLKTWEEFTQWASSDDPIPTRDDLLSDLENRYQKGDITKEIHEQLVEDIKEVDD